jgi:hypothetical protein
MPAETPALSPLEQQILKAQMKVRGEMPDVADAPIEPAGLVDRLTAALKERLVGGGRVVATADPFAVPTGNTGLPLPGAKVGRVVYHPDVLASQNPAEVEDTLAHELVHVRQGREAAGDSLFSRIKAKLESIKEGYLPYGQQPNELEAYQYEGDRAVSEGRVPAATPKFQLTPEDIETGRILREKGSIHLPAEKKKKKGT